MHNVLKVLEKYIAKHFFPPNSVISEEEKKLQNIKNRFEGQPAIF